MSDAYEIKTAGLEKLIKALKGKQPVARVGVLGDKTGRNETSLTNAAIGAAHEFGTTKLPQRSFLRIPISENLQKRMESAGAFDKETVAQVLKVGTILPWLKKVAILAEGIVTDAFATGGFGKWKPSNMLHKKVHMTLVETQQLRNSITSEVKE